MQRIAVLTSGGDAPGMNAAIRAVVRTGLNRGWQVYGIQKGFLGLINGNLRSLGARDVGGIIQRGGTVLGSARCLEFKQPEGQRQALRTLHQFDIDGLVVIGGNGSQTGAHALSKHGFPVVGVSSTIDNDLYAADITIGVDTALNIALEAIDRLKITASSHQRAFLVEVMGRNCGYLALMSAIAGGAEAVVLPENETDPEEIAEVIQTAYEKGKAHAIIVVAEGAKCNAQGLVEYFKQHRERLGFSVRATTLGHVQRGGDPGAFDRILASRLGAAATEQLEKGNFGVMTCLKKGTIQTVPLDEVVSNKKELDLDLFKLCQALD
ncbi:MAG: 6-phosphofructokinase [Anaerolineaceae bacterium]|nr:6-phosphofructokinase [Anaerolineaceae bacterium]